MTKTFSSASAPFLFLLALGMPSLANAADAKAAAVPSSPAPSADENPTHVRARELFREANEAYRARDLERARSLYQESLHLERSFDAVCNLGRTEADLAEDALALSHLDECLKEYPPGDAVAAAREKFFHLRETVRARCKENDCTAKPVEAKPGPEPTASVSPKTENPPEKSPRAAEKEQSTQEPSSLKWPVTIAMAGVGLAGVGTGLVFWLVADARADEARLVRDAIERDGGSCGEIGAHPSCGQFSDLYSAANTNSAIGVVGFAAGGALLAGSALLMVLWDEDEKEKGPLGAKVVPSVSSSFVGATLQGNF